MVQSKVVLVVTSLLVALTASSAEWSFKPTKTALGCRHIKPGTQKAIRNKNNACWLFHENQASKDFLERDVQFQECLCQLISMDGIWSAMLNEEMENVFNAIVGWNNIDKVDTPEGLVKRFKEYVQDANRKSVEDAYIINYVDPLDGDGDKVSEKLKKLEKACHNHLSGFYYFHYILKGMSVAVKNKRLIEEIAQFSPALFKNVLAHRFCMHLIDDLTEREPHPIGRR